MSIDLDQYWQRIAGGDEVALEELYKLMFPKLVRYVVTITGHQQLAEELVQDVLLKFWQNRSLIIIQGSFKSYLFKALHNYALNAVRQQRALKQTVNQPVSEEMWQFIADHYVFSEAVADRLYSDDTHKIIDRAVEELPEQCRLVFCMSRFDDMDNEEIAKKLNLSENTIKAHIYRALQKISGVLKNNL